MQKLSFLPKISIKDMENQINQRRTTHKKNNYQDDCREQEYYHHHDIKITSPFYEKNAHKDKCQCQYHRQKRNMIINKVNYRKRQETQIQGVFKKKEMKQFGDNNRDNNLKGKVQFQSPRKPLDPLEPIQPLDNLLLIKKTTQSDNAESLSAKKISKIPTRKTFRSINSKPTLQLDYEEETHKVNDFNAEYMKLISDRLQNQKFKQKYLKTLFGFIKMKSNQDRMYMHRSKAYIYNSLNMLLNHFTMDKLLKIQELTQDDTFKIGYYMNCFPQKVKSHIQDLGKAVRQMQSLLDDIRRKRKKDESENKEIEQFNLTIYGDLQQPNQSFKFNHLEKDLEEIQDKLRQSQNKQNTMLESIDQNLRIKNSTQNQNLKLEYQALLAEQEKKKNKNKTSILNSKDKINSFHRSSSKKSNGDLVSRHSILASHKNQQNINRNLRSTVLGIVDQIDKQNQNRVDKKRRTTKLKKGRLRSKIVDADIISEKYRQIAYDKYLAKKDFINLISQLQRHQQNDNERAHVLYKQFNIDSFLQNQQKIQDLIDTFKPFFNEKTHHQFLKQIVFAKDKRYIQKLQRELDQMLHQIKKNDPRNELNDFFQVKAEKKLPPTMNKIAKCREFKIDKNEAINHIKYFQAEQQIENHITQQDMIRKNLQQIQLKGINFQPINPFLSCQVSHKAESHITDAVGFRVGKMLDISHQKKILQYMKRNHEGTFNFLANGITNICKSLPKEHA